MRIPTSVSVVLVLGAVVIAAQAPQTFEVASVKANTSGSLGSQLRPLPGGRLIARNTPLSNLIRVSFGLQDFQLVGRPGWTDVARYDIDAKASGEATINELMTMLRSLLVERFGLAAHREIRQGPVYRLGRLRPDGTLGPALAASSRACEPMDAGTKPSSPASDSACGVRTDPGKMTARSVSAAQLAATLSTLANRPVIDETGLTGTFDAELAWTPDSVADTAGVSFFTAVQEQLGLKLTAATGPVEVVVIDDVRRLVTD